MRMKKHVCHEFINPKTKMITLKPQSIFLIKLALICTLFSFHQLRGEVVQRVRVLEYIPDVGASSPKIVKKPMPRVEVTVAGASSVITDENGECLLRFNTMKEGDRMLVRRVFRLGFEPMDPQALKNLVIRRNDEPIIILLISEENAIARNHYLEKLVDAQFQMLRQREIDRLDASAENYEQKKAEIEKKYEARLDEVEQYIDRLIRLDMSSLSGNESEAFKAFQRGDLEEALALLDKSDLIGRYRQTTESLNRLQEAHVKVDNERESHYQQQQHLEQYIRTQIALLEMEGSEKSLSKAMRLMEKLLDIDPQSEMLGKEYMQMVVQTQDFCYADSVLRLRLKQSNLTPEMRSVMAVNLGIILFEQKRYEEAMHVLQEVEPQLDIMAAEQPESALTHYLPLICYQMLGRCYMLYGTREEAINHYRIMFHSYLKLRQVDGVTKYYAHLSYPRLNRAIWRLCELQEWHLADTICSVAYPRVVTLFGNSKSIRDRYIVATFKMRWTFMLLHEEKIEEGLVLLKELQPEFDAIYRVNRPLCEMSYRHVLRKMSECYFALGKYEEMIGPAKRWFEIHDSSETQLKADEAYYQEDRNAYEQMRALYDYALSHIGKIP